MPRILVCNGPNLNLLGDRQPEIYGRTTLAEIESRLQRQASAARDLELRFFQSNSEGEILDWLQEECRSAVGAILNPGGLAHTSVVLRDAIAAANIPIVEVHLSNIHAREPFRRRSLLAAVCLGSLCGLGPYGYEAALEALIRHLHLDAP